MWVELKRSTMGLVAPLLMVLGVWGVVSSPRPSWEGYWMDTTLFIQTFSGLVIGPVVAAVCAWQGSRARGSGFNRIESVSVRTGMAVLLRPSLAVLAWGVLSAVVVLGFASMRTQAVGGPGLPTPSVLAVAVGVLALQASVGILCGTYLPKVVGPAVAVTVIYTAYFFQVGGPLSQGPRRLLPIIQEQWQPGLVPNTGLLGLAAAWCFAAAGTLLAIAGLRTKARTKPSHRYLTAVATVLITLVVAVAYQSFSVPPNESLFADPRSQSEAGCQPVGSMTVCTWTGDRIAADVLPQAAERVQAALAGYPGIPRTVAQQGVELPGAQVVSLRSSGSDVASVAAAIADSMVRAPRRCAWVKTDSEWPWRFVLRALVAGRLGVGVDQTGMEREIAAWSQLPEREQGQWLRAALSAYRSCHAIPPLNAGR